MFFSKIKKDLTENKTITLHPSPKSEIVVLRRKNLLFLPPADICYSLFIRHYLY